MKVVPALVLLLAAPAFSQSDAVFETEYDVVLTIDENQYRSQGIARVENNHVISVELQNVISVEPQKYKVELKVSLHDVDMYLVETSIFERAEENWVRMGNDESGGFGGLIGLFGAYNWYGDGMRLDMAITVSIAN